MARVIVERTFDKPLPLEDLRATEARMAPCLDLYGVRWIRSYWSTDRRRMVCEYEAKDAGAVREVQREAGATYSSVWTADVREP
jgi:hypothetical protein